MKSEENSHCRKIEYKKLTYELKLSIIDQIANGQISVNHAAKTHNVSRSSIDYWMRKFLSFEQKHKVMAKKDEIKKLKERIEELECIKDLQQIMIADFEVTTGIEKAKKYLPEALAKEIETKKKDLLK